MFNKWLTNISIPNGSIKSFAVFGAFFAVFEFQFLMVQLKVHA